MIVLNEKKYAIECLETGRIGDKPFFTLSILAKYYYYCLEYKKSKINTLLNEFMQKYYAGYQLDRMSWQDTIDNIVKKVNKFTLLEIDGVSITKSEMQTIAGIKNPKLERVMFTILCLAKFGIARNPNNNGWVNEDSKEIFKMARVSCKAEQRELLIGELRDMGLLEFPKRNDNLSMRVTFLDIDSPEEIFISDFRELGYEYLKYQGENFIRCAECGVLTRGSKKNNKKYCKNCSGYIPMKNKTIICEMCGKQFSVPAKNNKTRCCSDCQKLRNKEKTKDRVQKFRKCNVSN